jgi:hypothetical protein
MDDALKNYLSEAGAELRPGSDLPPNIRAEIERRAAEMPELKPGVELQRLEENALYTFDDGRLRLTVRVPSIPIFMAFVAEVNNLSKVQDVNGLFAVVARAFWLLHQSDRGLFGPRMPKVNTAKALAFLSSKIRRADYVMPSLSEAFLGLVEYVVGKKKVADVPATAESPRPSPE